MSGACRACVTAISVTGGTSCAVVEMTFQCGRDYRTAYRFIIRPSQDWFLAQFLLIENIGARPLRIAEYYHYARTKPGDLLGEPGVPNYYLPCASWRDKATGSQFGVAALHSDDFKIDFWIDQQDNPHPDARRTIDQDLDPGARSPPRNLPSSFTARRRGTLPPCCAWLGSAPPAPRGDNDRTRAILDLRTRRTPLMRSLPRGRAAREQSEPGHLPTSQTPPRRADKGNQRLPGDPLGPAIVMCGRNGVRSVLDAGTWDCILNACAGQTDGECWPTPAPPPTEGLRRRRPNPGSGGMPTQPLSAPRVTVPAPAWTSPRSSASDAYSPPQPPDSFQPGIKLPASLSRIFRQLDTSVNRRFGPPTG